MTTSTDGPFFLFAGPRTSPRGGLGDYVGSFATLEEAHVAAPGAHEDWAEVVTVQDGCLVSIATY